MRLPDVRYAAGKSISLFRNYLKLLRIDKKLLAVCVLSLFIPITLSGLYFSFSFARLIRENELNRAQASLDQLENYLKEILGKAVNIADRAYVNTHIEQTVAAEYRSTLEVYEAYRGVDFFDDYMRLYNEIAGIRLYVENPAMLDNSYFIVAGEETRQEDWYRKALALEGKMFWTWRRDTILRSNHLSLVRQIRNTTNGRHIGVLCVNLETGRLKRICAGEPHKTVISLNGEALISSGGGTKPGTETKENWIIANSFSPRQILNDVFEIAYLIPRKALFTPVYSVVRKSIVIILISLVLSLVFILQIINEVYIEKLQREQLSSRQKEMRLKLLSGQINPHFLYNTLETIRMMALEKDEPEIGETIKMLSKILRQNLKADEKTVPLNTEIELIRNYLDIQKLRFGSRINYSVNMEEAAGRCRILPLLIQPLVENSFIHGLETKPGGGYIRLDIGRKEGTLLVEVADNGKGMDAERLEYIRKNLESPEEYLPGERIGLANVNQRIRLYYGDSWGLEISPGGEAGIRVRMRVPALEDEREVLC